MAISFPPTINGGSYVAENGLTYYYSSANHSWVTTAPEYVFPDPDDYVLRAGDDMTGSLKSTRFVANYGLESLDDIG